MAHTKQFETGSKKPGRGRAKKTIELIEAMQARFASPPSRSPVAALTTSCSPPV
jgi:hypothetical protein